MLLDTYGHVLELVEIFSERHYDRWQASYHKFILWYVGIFPPKLRKIVCWFICETHKTNFPHSA